MNARFAVAIALLLLAPVALAGQAPVAATAPDIPVSARDGLIPCTSPNSSQHGLGRRPFLQPAPRGHPARRSAARRT